MDAFDAQRALLLGLAYRMLGTRQDAEDAVQEAWLRWNTRRVQPDNPRAYLCSIVTHLCLDKLKSAAAQREVYPGQWLPEPVNEDVFVQPEAHAELADSIGMAFMVMLQSLSAAERAAFLLHDVFGHGYDALAGMLNRDEAACRQLVSRARSAVQQRKPRFEPDAQRAGHVLQAFMAACASGDLERLKAVLTDDVRAMSDGGGKVRGAGLVPVTGVDNVARLMLGLLRQMPANLSIRVQNFNGQPALHMQLAGQTFNIMCFEFEGERVRGIYSVLNPGKLVGKS